MTSIKKFTSIEEFISINQQHFFGNRSLIFHQLLSIINGISNGAIEVRRIFNICENETDEIVCFLTDAYLYLLTPNVKVSPTAIAFLKSEINFNSFNNFQFIGDKHLIVNLLKTYNLEYEIFKDRIVYECRKFNPIKQTTGKLVIPTDENIEELAQMNLKFHQEEYGQSAFRSIDDMRNFVTNAIKFQSILLWIDKNEIVSMLNATMNDTLFYIAHIYTKPSKRSKGYGSNLLHYASSAMLSKGIKRVGLVSDTSNAKSNAMFRNLGFVCIYEIFNVVTK